MRTLCDVCESAAAILFCAADEAALCRACDEKVHLCNKLANRHVRVGLSDPRDVPCCDICENAPAFFYCEVDGTSLCLQCDMVVHVGGKRTHARYLLLRQRIEFPREKPSGVEETGLQTLDQNEVKREHNQLPDIKTRDPQNQLVSPVKEKETDAQAEGKMGNKLIDLNSRPRRIRGQTSINQDMDAVNGSNHESVSVVPVAYFKREPEK